MTDDGDAPERSPAPPGPPTPDTSCTGVVLAGGRSVRFGGQPKGLLSLAGRRMIDRVADALRAVCATLALAANADDAREWLPGATVIRDVHHGGGPLAGIHAALATLARPVLVVAWDMPFVTPELLAAIRDAAASPDVLAVVPESAAGRPEPLCAWYAPACAPRLDAALRAGERRALSVTASLPGVRRLPVEELRTLGDPALLLRSVNTPEELERAVQRVTRPG